MHSNESRVVQRLRKLLDGISVGLLTTQTVEGESRSRPMLVQDLDDGGWLWFLTDRDSRKACDLIRNPQAAVTFQSPKGERYISVHGTAVVVRDDLRAKQLWNLRNPTYRTWFPKGRTDPALALIAVRVVRAEYWLVPRSRLARVLGATKAMVTGRRYDASRHGVLELHPG